MAKEQETKTRSNNRQSAGKGRSKGSGRGRSRQGNTRNSRDKVEQQEVVLVPPPKYRKGSMRIVPLGGLGEIGRNMNVIEYNGHILLIDCGVLFPEEEQPGVDLILPDFSYIKDRLDEVDALVLTHGHEDHIGGVPYLLKLRPDIPLIGSKLTLAFVDAKCKEHRLNPTKVEVEGRDKLKVGPFTLEFITVTHSIPDALAVSVKTPAGHIIDTGDMKLDQLPLDHKITDLREFSRLGEQGVDLLMVDSTNAEVPGFVKPETTIGPALDRAFAEATRKIIVASFSSHVHRVQQVVDAAHKNGRKVVFVGRSMVRNMGIASDLGYLHLPENTVVDLKQAHDIQDDKIVYMCTGSQGEPMAALGRIADGTHRDITVNEFDTVVLASSLIPGNEHGVYRVINKLIRMGARVINKDNAAIHVSGHADEGELLYFYNIVQPKCAMPIHGENRHLVANGLIAVKTGVDPQNVVLAEDGDVVDLYHGQAAVVGSVPCGYVYVDGDSVGELTDDELEKRRILGSEGFVSAFAVVDTESSDVVSGPKIFLNAVAEDESEFVKVREQITQQLQDAMMQGTRSTYQLQQIMRRTLGGWVSRKLHRRPMIVPVVADLAQDVQKQD
ncbi:ribonuclease J [Bifidobacterium crudilactis]|jgi:ribonuclease J|uniref:Ribonuclease J n=1 Tax=Bifidobacterium crudilactis TaxID=327277 RepID=A0A971CYA3_9BIFI|nr:ribonuclease J [Bifidobacterium crudilactis]MCI1869212.1 ribonuclease J [Bifidobacterium crudilactis]MDN5972423.1 ribonuclease J [Bifidobacterium crudilactis]MDN6000333.1 ribonuclease J [Bifidobacterium crudilactis]MDN6209798.1 ribonuclease J [Bifidobacterium crudilactis]MDN6233975.1 ribonuclease J [Bifidobacterium crudilactis]